MPAFGEAIHALMEAPAPSAAPPRTERAAASGGKAAVPAATRRPRLALREALGPVLGRLGTSLRERRALAAVAGGLLLLVAVGLAGGLTPYGLFFHRALQGGLGPSRPGAKLLAEARISLATGTYPGARAALDLADRALRLQPSDREAKAVYAVAAVRLATRHGGATEAEARARSFLSDLGTRADEEPLAAWGVVAASSLPGEPPAPAAAAALARWLARSPGEAGGYLSLAEAALVHGELGAAAGYLDRLEARAPGAAPVAHARGLLALRTGDAAGARKHFEAALAKDGSHLASALELSALALAGGDRPRPGPAPAACSPPRRRTPPAPPSARGPAR